MSEVNEIKEPSTETNQKPDLIGRFAEINGISREEATNLIDAETEEEILKKIENYTLQRINENIPKLNRAQRRALAKKAKKKQLSPEATEAIAETTKKINYINLIQQLKELNEKRENENYDNANENN